MNVPLSVIIPTYNRQELLLWTLEELSRQSLSPDKYEVIVVNDGGEKPQIDRTPYSVKYLEQKNAGPGAARNKGASHAKGEILLFIGDDCIPHKNLLYRHLYNHKRDGVDKIVQGYTAWHEDVAGSAFHQFLYDSGLQANWNGLRNEDGSWRYDISAEYCLTTNYSIHRRYFDNLQGFDSRLAAAAWDDIEFGFRAARYSYPAVFDPGAVNYHHHRYTIDNFVERQKREGYWRVQLGLIHPELAPVLMRQKALDNSRKNPPDMSHILHEASRLDAHEHPRLMEIKYAAWQEAANAASLLGTREGLESFHPALEATYSAVDNDTIMIIFSGVSALMRGETSYAFHCVNWLIDKLQGGAAAFAYGGEIYAQAKDEDAAIILFRKSLEAEPNEWAEGRLYDLKG